MSIYKERLNISVERWEELLQDSRVFKDDDIILIRTLYKCKGCRERASVLANIIGTNYQVLNLQIGRLGKRIVNEFPDVEFPTRENGKILYWYIPFVGEDAETPGQFYWELRSELKQAIKELFDNTFIAEEISEEQSKKLFEGAKKQIIVNAYERNSKARKECIDYYGAKCQICDFDFGKFYGDKFCNVIQVHHIKPLSQIKEGYTVNPKTDLIPVCPNCHAALHSKTPPYTPHELKALIKSKI